MVMSSKERIDTESRDWGSSVGVGEAVISNGIIRKGFTVKCHLDKTLRIPGSQGSRWRAQQIQKLREEGGKEQVERPEG